jgi:hypothetical protein
VLTSSTVTYGLRPEVGYRAVPSDYGIIYESVTFETPDSLTLQGWFFPAQDTAGIANQLVGRMIPVPPYLIPPERSYDSTESQPRATIVICPGDAGNMTYSILYAYNLFTQGFNVFTFDWRGFGESDAWSMDSDRLIYSEFLTDYATALDYLQTRPDTDSSRLGVLGFSTGAYISFAMAAQRNDISALVSRATITSFDDLLSILSQLDPERAWHAPEDYPENLLPANAAPSITTPVFLIVGQDDERTPVWISQRVYDLLSGPKQLWVVEGAAHGGRQAPELVAYDEFFEKIISFFKQHLCDED